ncbi:hypothetical protein MIMGU_mgv1a025750mg, partial [Erythranthe guttata]
LAAFDLGTSTPAISKFCPTSDSCRRFLLEEIKSATSNFDDNSIICKGRFSDVYKGFIEDRATTLAIKRVKKLWDSDFHKFLHKIDMASKLRHLHVVSPIGYCDEDGEMILVYDYMVHGSLYDHLYKKNPPLKWKQRLQICIGAARGLHYLNNTVNEYHKIHRIVNSTNILLDEKWVAKVSVAPTYIWHGSMIEEKDNNVYSFGLVLLQVLFIKPRKPLDIHQYAESCRRGAFKKYIDPNLNRQIAPQCLSKFVETALACIKKEICNTGFSVIPQMLLQHKGKWIGDFTDKILFLGKNQRLVDQSQLPPISFDPCLINHGNQRPSMNNIVTQLEAALEQQEAIA